MTLFVSISRQGLLIEQNDEVGEVVHVGGLKVEEVEEGRVVDGERGPRRGARGG